MSQNVKISIVTAALFLFAAIAYLIYNNYFGKLAYFIPHSEPQKATDVASENTKILFGTSLDMSQILPTSPKYIRRPDGEDLIDVAHMMGINFVRITNSESSHFRPTMIYTEDEWKTVLDKLASYGMQADVLIETPALSPDDYSDSYLDLVRKYVVDSQVVNNPAVFSIDIRNEPIINSKSLDALASAASIVKSANPQMRVTIGGWRVVRNGSSLWLDPDAGAKLNPIVDFYSIHLYEFDKSIAGIYPDPYSATIAQLDKTAKYAGSKRVLIEEFGAGNGSAITDQDTLGSPQMQEKIYAGVFDAALENSDSVVGVIAYTLYPKDSHTSGWNILDSKFAPFPAAKVLEKFAKGDDSPLDLPTVIPRSIIVTTDDADKTINLNRGDYLGFEITLSQKKTYFTSISNTSVLKQNEKLQLGGSGDYYNMAFVATSAGSSIISVHQCQSLDTCHTTSSERFRVTVSVK
ncbi:MAG TPA: cellulase family glycosylhydrolase [Patescibacteria group bacterium]|nr:cellulase family glycosylhydrolase [Patescibacteria group bacterium]